MSRKYNRIQTINTDTGEVVSTQLVMEGIELVGNKLITKSEESRNKGFKEKCKKSNDIIEFIQSNEGSYYHLIYKYGYPIMDRLQAKYEGNKANIHIIRLIQLANHVTFGGKLFDENRNEIKKSSLGKIWGCENNRKSTNETYNMLKECGYIYESEEGYIMISEDLIVKGAIEDFKKLHKEDSDLTYTRVFSNNVKDMYEGTKPTQRKQLANLFKVLSFINFKHNVFCMNPQERDHTKLQLLTWKDLARLCGENETNSGRLKKDLMKLKIYGYDVIGQFESGSGKAICVNPKVYYGGDNIKDVRKIYTMFEMCEGRKY